jgi:hypothetical protein
MVIGVVNEGFCRVQVSRYSIRQVDDEGIGWAAVRQQRCKSLSSQGFVPQPGPTDASYTAKLQAANYWPFVEGLSGRL